VTPIVGRLYSVPCIFVASQMRTAWMPRDGWVPTLGPKHSDAEHLDFAHPHYHVDWRFVGDKPYEAACWMRGADIPHARVVTSTTMRYVVAGSLVMKRRACRRAMPDFPAHNPKSISGPDKRWVSLERAHRGCTLRPGNICPHRGIDLTTFIKPDGTVVCPGHGLAWDTRTGELLQRHEVAA
jgi:nitrite reductase/ring-hydroxylating ferredoxin subunit